MKTFNVNKTIKEIESYLTEAYNIEAPIIDKLFYHFNEWSGWRFYIKAIKYRDWKSIIEHIKKKN